uniref:Mucin-17-like n=1 Tax=Petromyzon marinus TaxID=7757 RepID=A0AAJ7TKU7_PETMA|nr:mucin-17-like [Petromyzon marinus]
MRCLGSLLLLTGWWMVVGANSDPPSDVTTVKGVLSTLNAVNPSASTSPPLATPATTQLPSKATVTQPTKQLTTLNKSNNVASSPSSTAPSLSTPLSSTPPSSTPPSSATTTSVAAAAAAASPAAIEKTSSHAVATPATNTASTPANTNSITPTNTNSTTPTNTNTTTPFGNNNRTSAIAATTTATTITTAANETNIATSPSTNATELPNNASITLQTANSSTVTPTSPSSSTSPSATPGVSQDAATVVGTGTTPPSATEAANSSVTTAGGAAAGEINNNNTNNRFDASTAKTATPQDASEGGVSIDDRGIDGGKTLPPPTARPSKTEAVTEPDSSDSGHQAAGAERPGGPRHNVRTVLLAVGCSCLVLLVSAMLLYSKRRTRNKSWYVHNDHQVLENPCYENGCHDNGGNSNGGCHDNPAMEAIAGGPAAAASAAAAADGWPDEAWRCDTSPPLRPPGRAAPARMMASPSVGVDAWVVPLDNVSSGDDPLAGLMQDTRL